ncbi:MAG: hypothetical protein KJO58_04495, partial [Gammaproteobacteria bacterium]|nr:hypothetical protein [Gammaproteobacteria bacterium]
EGQYGGTGMDRYEWQLELTLYAASDDDVSEAAVNTVELAELSGIELYRVDLYIDWKSGNRQRDMHFSTIRSVLANR